MLNATSRRPLAWKKISSLLPVSPPLVNLCLRFTIPPWNRGVMPSDHAVVSTSRFFTYQRSLDRGLGPHQSDHHGRTRNSKERENSSHASCLRKSSVRASPESRRKQHPSRASPSAPRPISGATRVRGRGSCAPSFVSWQLERGGKQATARERQSRAPAQASVFVIHTRPHDVFHHQQNSPASGTQNFPPLAGSARQ